MWDDIIIGKGEKGNSAIKVFKIEGLKIISENSVSYWIHGAFLDTGLTIMKDTPEGGRLTKMIELKKSAKEIVEYIDSLVIKRLSPERFKHLVTKSNKEWFQKGREAKAHEIKKALYL